MKKLITYTIAAISITVSCNTQSKILLPEFNQAAVCAAYGINTQQALQGIKSGDLENTFFSTSFFNGKEIDTLKYQAEKINFEDISAMPEKFTGYVYLTFKQESDTIIGKRKIETAIFQSLDGSKYYSWPEKYISSQPQSNIDLRKTAATVYSKSLDIRFNKSICGQLKPLHKNFVYMLGENRCEESKQRFDLSGFTKRNDSIFAIADKKWTTSVYKIDTMPDNYFYIQKVTANVAYTTEDCDIEAIDIFNGHFVISEETFNNIYIQNNKGDFETTGIDYASSCFDKKQWGEDNTGVEAIAADDKDSLLYIIKEREPRRILQYDFKTKKISFPADSLVMLYDGDISDAQFENGNLYLLERAGSIVRKINISTGETYCMSFAKYARNNKQHIYDAEFATAEAMVLTDNAIFIGFDNNGDQVTEFGQSIGLKKGNKSAIMVFERPKGF